MQSAQMSGDDYASFPVWHGGMKLEGNRGDTGDGSGAGEDIEQGMEGNGWIAIGGEAVGCTGNQAEIVGAAQGDMDDAGRIGGTGDDLAGNPDLFGVIGGVPGKEDEHRRGSCLFDGLPARYRGGIVLEQGEVHVGQELRGEFAQDRFPVHGVLGFGTAQAVKIDNETGITGRQRCERGRSL